MTDTAIDQMFESAMRRRMALSQQYNHNPKPFPYTPPTPSTSPKAPKVRAITVGVLGVGCAVAAALVPNQPQFVVVAVLLAFAAAILFNLVAMESEIADRENSL